MTYKVRGPCPDGDYFIVEVIDGEETALDETFRSEEEALAAIPNKSPSIAGVTRAASGGPGGAGRDTSSRCVGIVEEEAIVGIEKLEHPDKQT